MKKKCAKFRKVFEVIKILEQKAVGAFTNYHWPRNISVTITHTVLKFQWYLG